MKPNKLKNNTHNVILVFPFFVGITILFIISCNNMFFWDTVQLGSRHAHFFYENNFKYLFLPQEFDSGHIPIFGMYLAIVWKIFGKTLLVSHLSMLPFIYGIIWQSFLLIKKLLKQEDIFFGLLIFLGIPTLLSQLTLISPDVVLIFFFLLTLNSILTNKRLLIFFGILGLFLISMRGTMVAFALLFIDLFVNYQFKPIKIKPLFKMSLSYIPALIVFISYFTFHYINKGWIVYHSNSPWSNSFQFVNIQGFIYNIGILFWRLIDFGQIFIITTFVVSLFFLWRNKMFKEKKTQLLLFIIFICVIILSMPGLIYSNLLAHRYLLPIFLSISLFVAYFISQNIKKTYLKRTIYIILFIGLLSGNFWVYPDKIAQGWDSTLAHLPYYSLRKKMLEYIDNEKISYDKIGSDFPNISEIKYIDLNNKNKKFTEKNLNKNNYVMYSNIYNNFSDNEIDNLLNDWILVKEYKRMQIKVCLYKKPKK